MNRPSALSGQSVSLVLGSGGARGLAHIGVIRRLEESGARIEAIAGCSMGALVGGIYVSRVNYFVRSATIKMAGRLEFFPA